MTHNVVAIPGDGIGPEVMDATMQVLEAAKAPISFSVHDAGQAALDKGAEQLLPTSTIEAIRESKVALKGPCTTPIGKGFRSINVSLRQTLKLYAAVRPVRSLPGVKTRYEDVDLVIVRENTEGLYSGIENEITEDTVVSMKVATRPACERISRWAFEYAAKRGRKKITVFHKANIMKLTDGMFLDEFRKVAKGHPETIADEMIIDAAEMRLVQDPRPFDIILCENLYGDIVSDLCAGMVGGLGVTPGANIGDDCAVFEAVHGSAPDIAGKGVANPLALIMSATMMLNYLRNTRDDLACGDAAERLKHAYNGALEAGDCTGDLGGKLNTKGFVEALVRRIDG